MILTERGHPDPLGMTPRQIAAVMHFSNRQRRRDLIEQIRAVRAAQADPKKVDPILKRWERDLG